MDLSIFKPEPAVSSTDVLMEARDMYNLPSSFDYGFLEEIQGVFVDPLQVANQQQPFTQSSFELAWGYYGPNGVVNGDVIPTPYESCSSDEPSSPTFSVAASSSPSSTAGLSEEEEDETSSTSSRSVPTNTASELVPRSATMEDPSTDDEDPEDGDYDDTEADQMEEDASATRSSRPSSVRSSRAVSSTGNSPTTSTSNSPRKSRKRSRDSMESLDMVIPTKVPKLDDNSSPTSSVVGNNNSMPYAVSMVGTPQFQSLLEAQYSSNQRQIQQVLATLDPAQIQHVAAFLAACGGVPSGKVLVHPLAASSASFAAASFPSQQAPHEFSVFDYSATTAPDVAASVNKKPKKTGQTKKSGQIAGTNSTSTSKKRPKLDPKKDALQCLGHNRKKNKQCGNAALMEFIGPRPIYCAEHIDLDPMSLYTKCRSTHLKQTGEGKGCREVVLKELGLCHKHFDQVTSTWPLTPSGLATARTTLDRVSEILDLLENEAAAAKKTDPDLFQRKHKIIPKFEQLIQIIEQWIVAARTAGVTAVSSPADALIVPRPIV